MIILVTNDDGESNGLKVLFEAAKDLGKAYILMPDKQRSAVSKSLTLHKPIRIHKLRENVYDTSGTPADAVLFALHSGEFPKPDLVLSGINFGDNTSTSSILCSGTLGACWEATLAGVPAIGFSLYKENYEWRRRSELEKEESWGDSTLLKDFIKNICAEKIERGCFLNANFPTKLTKNTKIVHSDNPQQMRFRTMIEKREDPSGSPYYWLGGDFTGIEPGTDLHEVAVNKNIVITKVHLEFTK